MPRLGSVLVVAGLLRCGLILSTTGAPRAIADAVKDVIVDNTVANPVGVVAADNPARNPFQKGVFSNSFNHPVPVFTVPAGERLVIDFFSAESFVPSGQTVSRFIVGVQDPNLPPGTVSFSHFVAPISGGPFGGQSFFLASQPMELFVDPGQELVVNAVGDSPSGGAFMSFSGHLVNLP